MARSLKPLEESGEHDLTARLAGLVKFLPVFTDPDFFVGNWQPEFQNPENKVHQMPYFVYAPEMLRFIEVANELDWVVTFPWPDWMNTQEARMLVSDPESIANASVEQLEKLITAIIRSDRFTEGSIAGAFEQGLIAAIIHRAEALLHEMNG